MTLTADGFKVDEGRVVDHLIFQPCLGCVHFAFYCLDPRRERSRHAYRTTAEPTARQEGMDHGGGDDSVSGSAQISGLGLLPKR